MKGNINIPIYILCGGKSSRMQTEKGLVNYNGKAFIQWVTDTAKLLSKDIFLVTNNADYSVFNLPLIEDFYKEKGPMGGIFSALKHTKSNQILVLSCDIPKITPEVLKTYLIDNFSDDLDVMMLKDDQKIYPLIGIYSKTILEAFETSIKAGKLKLIRTIEEFKHQYITVDKKDTQTLVNINTKDELQALENMTL